jgi:hypothetical protein
MEQAISCYDICAVNIKRKSRMLSINFSLSRSLTKANKNIYVEAEKNFFVPSQIFLAHALVIDF